MKKRYDLLIVGLLLLGLFIHLYITHFSYFMNNAYRQDFPLAQYLVGAFGATMLFGAGVELTSVGAGIYQNRYTDTRFFKGILY